MTPHEKATFLQGFDLLKAKPSIIGKIFGVSEQEANQILKDVFKFSFSISFYIVNHLFYYDFKKNLIYRGKTNT